MQDLAESGRMVAVLAAEDHVTEAMAEYEEQVSIAAVNSPRQTVISGLAEAVETVEARLHAAGLTTRRRINDSISNSCGVSTHRNSRSRHRPSARRVKYGTVRSPITASSG